MVARSALFCKEIQCRGGSTNSSGGGGGSGQEFFKGGGRVRVQVRGNFQIGLLTSQTKNDPHSTPTLDPALHRWSYYEIGTQADSSFVMTKHGA